MVINHNVSALNTLNKYGANTKAAQNSLEKLSSGLRINRAGDDAAGLAISQKMQAQINGLDQASKNAQDGISLVQTAEGALSETQSILQRMGTLANQAANGTLQTTDASNIQSEIAQLTSEIDRISQSTTFNGTKLLDGNFGVGINAGSTTVAVGSNGVTSLDVSGAKASKTYTLTYTSTNTQYTLSDSDGNAQVIQGIADGSVNTLDFNQLGIKIGLNKTHAGATVAAGANNTIVTNANSSVVLQIGATTQNYDSLTLAISDMSTTGLGVTTPNVKVDNRTDALATITNVSTALDKVSTQRANLGAYQNRLEHTINNLSTESQNLSAASSQITDVDMASEMTNFTKNNILTQAAQAMLAQANQLPQGVLSLLK